MDKVALRAPARQSQQEDLGGRGLNPLVLGAFIPVSPYTLAGEMDPECWLAAAGGSHGGDPGGRRIRVSRKRSRFYCCSSIRCWIAYAMKSLSGGQGTEERKGIIPSFPTVWWQRRPTIHITIHARIEKKTMMMKTQGQRFRCAFPC